MDYGEALRYLMSFADFERSGRFQDRPDVEPVRALLGELGDPHLGRPTVHIAGSKGKGSTAAMIAAIVRAAGCRAGLFTSPHLHRFAERIAVDGEPLPEEAFASAVTDVAGAAPAVLARFPDRRLVTFDLLTAAGFAAFRQAGVDVQVVEVGLGGLLDSTNVFDRKEVAVITPISLEHEAILGATVDRIARQKAGIITAGCTVVMGLQREPAAEVIRETCRERGARLLEVAACCALARTGFSSDGQDFRLRTGRTTYNLRLPLLGRHQLENAATAVLAAEALADACGLDLPPAAVQQGLAAVRWPGRLETIGRRPLLVVDGAHNADSVRRLREAMEEYFGLRQAVLLVGTLAGKDVAAMAAEIEPLASSAVTAAWEHPRAAPPDEVARAFAERGLPVSWYGDLDGALAQARALAGTGGAICAFGSVAFAGAVRTAALGLTPEPIPTPAWRSAGRS